MAHAQAAGCDASIALPAHPYRGTVPGGVRGTCAAGNAGEFAGAARLVRLCPEPSRSGWRAPDTSACRGSRTRSGGADYLPETAMVTPGCAETPPNWTDSGTWPAVRPDGICTLIWVRPGTTPGMPPQYSGLTFWPPIVTTGV